MFTESSPDVDFKVLISARNWCEFILPSTCWNFNGLICYSKVPMHYLESPGNEKKCPGKSWKLMNIRKLRFIRIWNDDCCSISLKFEIPSTFLGKISWKLTQKCPGKSWKWFKTFEWEPCIHVKVTRVFINTALNVNFYSVYRRVYTEFCMNYIYSIFLENC